MAKRYRFLFLLTALLFAAPLSMHAQNLTNDREAPRYATERKLIKTTLETIVAVIQEATLRHEGSGLSDRLSQITSQLTDASQLMPASPNDDAIAAADLDELRRLLRNITDDMEALRKELESEEEYDLADRLGPIHRDLRSATREADRLADAAPARDERMTTEDGNRWLRPGRYSDRDARREETLDERIERKTNEMVTRKQEDMEEKAERRWASKTDDWEDKDDRDRDRWRRGYGWHGMGAFVGEYSSRWPYRRETGVYQNIPAIRYNRVEGFVLGIGRRPLEWEGYGRARVYGQLGYAFSLDDWRYEIGLETRLDRAHRDDFGLKVGGAYHHNTASKDSWKTSWLENSLAAFLFENDFFDYHEVEGWTIYGVQRLTPYVQVSVGYRQDDYRSLEKETGWSLFDGGGFRLNPDITDGDMQSLVFAVEGGRVHNLHSLPSGAVFRVEAEVGNGIGGDFEFNRYVADGRGYLRLSRNSSLGVRLRGGYTDGDVIPLQKTFTIGGIGTTRSYAQNAFPGTRMLLGNAEYIVGDISLFDDFFDDLQLIGLFDAGWVNTTSNEFQWDDVLPSAGFGIGLDDRAVRLELSWPLRDIGGTEPTLWLRISPNF